MGRNEGDIRDDLRTETETARRNEQTLDQRINYVDAARIANNIRVYNTIMEERRITDDQIDRAHDRMDSLNQIFNNKLESLEKESVQKINDMANNIYLSLEEQGINEMQARQILEDRLIFLMGKQTASLTDAINTVQKDLRIDLAQAIETAVNAREEIITELRGTTDTLEKNIRSGLETARKERQALGQSISDESKRAQDAEAQERARAVSEERRIEQRAVSGLRGLQRSTDRDTQETRQQIADESNRAQNAEAQERARAVNEERRIEQRAVSGLR